MRFIGTVANENQAQQIVAFLKMKGIDSHSDPAFEAATGYMSYRLWVLDEDKLGEAKSYFSRFEQNPADPEFQIAAASVEELQPPPSEVIEEERVLKKPGTPVTVFFLALCMVLFMWSSTQEILMEERGFGGFPLALAPIEADLLYDVPPAFEAFQETFDQISPNEKFSDLPLKTQEMMASKDVGPFFRGLYGFLALKFRHLDETKGEGPLFFKISQGEVWRLFSPALLHGGFFHILFNMLWLWFLGRPIEERIGVKKTLGFTLIAGIGSNTAQYLMSGPLFLGYSGIIMGLASFIWMRQRVAPWEGYPINRSVLYFLFLFVAAVFVFSLTSFTLRLFWNLPASASIANTAHIAGGVIGIFLARSKFFAAKVIK